MKLLCADCFEDVVIKKSPIAECVACGRQYNLREKASLFKVRLEGGYVKDGMTKAEVVELIKSGRVKPDEYISSQSGAWVTLFNSSLAHHVAIKQVKNTRTKHMLYQKRTSSRLARFALLFVLMLSLLSNGALLYIVFTQQTRITELVTKITGGF